MKDLIDLSGRFSRGDLRVESEAELAARLAREAHDADHRREQEKLDAELRRRKEWLRMTVGVAVYIAAAATSGVAACVANDPGPALDLLKLLLTAGVSFLAGQSQSPAKAKD